MARILVILFFFISQGHEMTTKIYAWDMYRLDSNSVYQTVSQIIEKNYLISIFKVRCQVWDASR